MKLKSAQRMDGGLLILIAARSLTIDAYVHLDAAEVGR